MAEYRKLGRTGVRVSPLCLGTMNFGPRTSTPESIRIIHAALDSGLNFIDTADFYGQPLNNGRGQGTTERIVGEALKDRRDSVVLATKFFATTNPDDPNARGGSRRHVIQACEDSLRRLNTDYIDLYQMHRPDVEVPIDETLRALDDLVRAGKVRYIGTSTFAGWQVVEALWQSERLGINRFISEQPRYSLVDRRIEEHLIPVALKYGVAVLPYSPLAGGILAGKYDPDEEAPKDSRAADEAWGTWARSFLSEKVYALVEVLRYVAAEHETSPSQIALAWVLAQPGVTSAIIGPRTMDHFEDNLAATQITLRESDLESLNAASIAGGKLFNG